MGELHGHRELELPEPLRPAVEAGARALAPMVDGCVECARILAAVVLEAAMPELERARLGANGHKRRKGK